MLPNIRFAIGAVLASAVFIVTAFALAATVRMSQYRAAPPPLETALAYSDPAEWDRRPDALRRLEELRGDAGREVLLDRLAAAPTTPITTGRADATAAAVREEAADRQPTEVALPSASVALPLPGEAISPLPARAAEEIVARLETPAAPAPGPTGPLSPQSGARARPVAPAEALSPPTAMAADAATVAPPVAPAEAATATAAVTAEPQAAQPVVIEQAVRVALAAPVEAAAETSPRAAASIAAPAHKALSKLRKKFAAAKKFARVRAPRAGAWIQPT